MRKGIAIETILYLLIGVLVVGVVIYLVYSYVMNPALPETECRTLATSWCTSCKNANPSGTWTNAGPTATADLQACGGKYWTAPTWTNCATAQTFCSQCCAVS